MDMHDHHTMSDVKTASTIGNITEFSINWPLKPGQMGGSTHELVISDEFIFVTGQNMDQVAKFNYAGELLAYYAMPEKSGPHGLLLDAKGNLWVSLEFSGHIARLDENGKILESFDVKIYPDSDKASPINPAPHGIGLDMDGETIWFTGKRTSTIGKLMPGGEVFHYELPALASLPIYLSGGNKGGVWGTELLGNRICYVSADGKATEYKIPTSNSRPIAVINDPMNDSMWFTQESGVKIGKIDPDGTISEYPIPAIQKNDILASLCFDDEMNLWVQVYVDLNNPTPEGNDYIVKLDKSIRDVIGAQATGVPYSTHILPSRQVMMHRIRKDNQGNLWFTEMMTDKLGKVSFK